MSSTRRTGCITRSSACGRTARHCRWTCPPPTPRDSHRILTRQSQHAPSDLFGTHCKTGFMRCPTDDTTLVMSERNGIEIDYCPECRGVWLDRGELDKI